MQKTSSEKEKNPIFTRLERQATDGLKVKSDNIHSSDLFIRLNNDELDKLRSDGMRFRDCKLNSVAVRKCLESKNGRYAQRGLTFKIFDDAGTRMIEIDYWPSDHCHVNRTYTVEDMELALDDLVSQNLTREVELAIVNTDHSQEFRLVITALVVKWQEAVKEGTTEEFSGLVSDGIRHWKRTRNERNEKRLLRAVKDGEKPQPKQQPPQQAEPPKKVESKPVKAETSPQKQPPKAETKPRQTEKPKARETKPAGQSGNGSFGSILSPAKVAELKKSLKPKGNRKETPKQKPAEQQAKEGRASKRALDKAKEAAKEERFDSEPKSTPQPETVVETATVAAKTVETPVKTNEAESPKLNASQLRAWVSIHRKNPGNVKEHLRDQIVAEVNRLDKVATVATKKAAATSDEDGTQATQ